jgi:hypothetical protein
MQWSLIRRKNIDDGRMTFFCLLENALGGDKLDRKACHQNVARAEERVFRQNLETKVVDDDVSLTSRWRESSKSIYRELAAHVKRIQRAFRGGCQQICHSCSLFRCDANWLQLTTSLARQRGTVNVMRLPRANVLDARRLVHSGPPFKPFNTFALPQERHRRRLDGFAVMISSSQCQSTLLLAVV